MERIMMEYEEMVIKEIENIIDKGELQAGDVKNVGCAVDILKDLYTIEAMKKDTSYSGDRMSYRDGGNSGRSYDRGYAGRSYDRGYNYDFYQEDRLRRDMNNSRR